MSFASSSMPDRPERRPKSPPLAFERTSNDALIPPTQNRRSRSTSPSSRSNSNSNLNMGRASPLSPASNVGLLHVIVDQQHETIQGLHDAFAKERHTWGLERQHLLERVAQLEQLLKSDDHWRYCSMSEYAPFTADLMTAQQNLRYCRLQPERTSHHHTREHCSPPSRKTRISSRCPSDGMAPRPRLSCPP